MSPSLEEKVSRSILLIRHAWRHAFFRDADLELAYSGGKDSDVLLELCRMGGVKCRIIHRCTTIDPAGVLSRCRSVGAEIVRPRRSFAECIVRGGYPNRFYRHCCGELKEYAICDYVLVGIRRCESRARGVRYTEPESCRVYNGRGKCIQYYPLLDWSNDDVVEFIESRGLVCHPVYYDELGKFHVERRLGCMCCPLGGSRIRISQFERWPRMVRFYLRWGREYMRLHPACVVSRRYRDVYEYFVADVFCKDYDDFVRRFRGGGGDMFSDGNGVVAIDCRAWLEARFGGLDLGGFSG